MNDKTLVCVTAVNACSQVAFLWPSASRAPCWGVAPLDVYLSIRWIQSSVSLNRNLDRHRHSVRRGHTYIDHCGADKIVFLEDGEVRESGSHEELVALPNGHYRRFVELQTGAARGS